MAEFQVPKIFPGRGILSDSLEFRSPTTTETDKTHAAELGKLAGRTTDDLVEPVWNISNMASWEVPFRN